jgi:hypothetical protein
MSDLTSDAWAHIRHAYEHTDRPVADICAEHGISTGTLRDRVRRWRWARRRAPIPREGPPAVTPHEMIAPNAWPLGPRLRGDERGEFPQRTDVPISEVLTPTPTLPLAGGGSAEAAPYLAPGEGVTEPAESDPAAIAARLHSAVGRVLPAIEATIAKLAAGPQAPREMEQTARALGTMMRTLRELNALLAQQPPRAALDDDDIPEDIDAFREQLARKIEAFMESRGDEDFEEDEPPTCPGPAGRA